MKLTKEATTRLKDWVYLHTKASNNAKNQVDYLRGIIKGFLKRGKDATVYIDENNTKSRQRVELTFTKEDLQW